MARRWPVAGARHLRPKLADQTHHLNHQGNRTYDQIFGDLGVGNGQSDLAIFGSAVTPNHHALARQFELPVTSTPLVMPAPTGFLWTNALQHGKTARIFGEFANQTVVTPSTASWTDFYTAWKNKTTGPRIVGASSVKNVQPLLSPVLPGYDLRITEQIRADLFLQEFDQYEQNTNLPNLIVLEMPIDHTQGTSPGYPTPPLWWPTTIWRSAA